MAIIIAAFKLVRTPKGNRLTYPMELLWKLKEDEQNFDIYDAEIWRKKLAQSRLAIMQKLGTYNLDGYRCRIYLVGGTHKCKTVYPGNDKTVIEYGIFP